MLHIPFISDLHLTSDRASNPAHVSPLETLIVAVGRICFSAIFIVSGLNHLLNYSATVTYAMASGVAFPSLMVPLTGAMILCGGLMVLLGLWARLGAVLLILFLVPTTLIVHRFWGLADPAMVANQMAHFMKNVGLLGGALLVLYYGPGPLSLDRDTDPGHPEL